MLLNAYETIKPFLNTYQEQLTGSQIAKQQNLNQKTVANHLTVLEEQGILASTTQGRNKLYQFNNNYKPSVRLFILAAEHIKTLHFYQSYPIIKEIAEKIRPHINGSAILFGSYAKGIPKKHSDIDLLIIGSCQEQQIERVAKTYQKEINLKIYPTFEYDTLTKEAIAHHVYLKGAEEVVDKVLV